MAKTMTKEQVMAIIPKKYVSKNIFHCGFYYTGHGVKYRHTAWTGWKYIVNISTIQFLMYDISIKAFFLLSMAYYFFQGELFPCLFSLMLSGLIFNIGSLMAKCLCPIYAEIDLTKEVIRWGYVFKKEISFEDIAYLKVVRLHSPLGRMKNDAEGIYLRMVFSEKEHHFMNGCLNALIVRLPFNEVQCVEDLKNVLISLMKIDIPIKYFMIDQEVEDITGLYIANETA